MKEETRRTLALLKEIRRTLLQVVRPKEEDIPRYPLRKAPKKIPFDADPAPQH